MAIPASYSVSLTGIPDVDRLLEGGSWLFPANNVLTYSLHNLVSNSIWTPQEITAVRNAFDTWEAVANLDFVRVNGTPDAFPELTSADIAISFTGSTLGSILDPNTLALGIFPDPSFVDSLLLYADFTRVDYPHPEGDIFIDDFDNTYWFDSLNPGGEGFHTIVHEIGHTLGLSHPYGDGLNSNQLETVMSYKPVSQVFSLDEIPTIGHAATPMPYDILAIQHIYGPNMSYHTGNDNYVLSDDGVVKTIWDAGGIDTLNASGVNNGIGTIIDLTPGGFSLTGAYSVTAVAFNVVIENAIGSEYDDFLLGNGGDNTLQGLGGNDEMWGYGGFDLVTGGLGDDILHGGDRADNLHGDGGDDELYGDPGLDRLFGGTGEDSLNGGAGTDALFGDGGFDLLHGDAGDDRLHGGDQADNLFGDGGDDELYGDLGLDRLFGGTGEDTLHGGDGNDALFGDGGFDLLYGDAGNDRLHGGDQADNLFGDGGDDELFGDLGLDRLFGGTGQDVLYGGQGPDSLFGDAGFDLLHGGTDDDRLHGGDQADNLFGDAGNDELYGDLGLDRLFGATGNDIMAGGQGNDVLFGGLGNDDLAGDAGDDRLFGGAGFDRLNGGSGDDILQGDYNADVFIFGNNFGNDTITDFEATNDFEVIDFSENTLINGFSELETGHITQVNADTLISLGDDSLTLLNVNIGDLDGSDFIFS